MKIFVWGSQLQKKLMFFHVNQIAGKKKKTCSFSMPQPNIKLTFQKAKKKSDIQNK